MKYTETGLLRKIGDIKKDLRNESHMRKIHEKEIEKLRIVLRFYEEKLREIRFRNPSSRING